jgi:hypothetical protein
MRFAFQLVIRPDDLYSIRLVEVGREVAVDRDACRSRVDRGRGAGSRSGIASAVNRHVMITSNYTGVELVLFGSVERDAASAARTVLRYRRDCHWAARDSTRPSQSTRARDLGEYRGADVRRSAVATSRCWQTGRWI